MKEKVMFQSTPKTHVIFNPASAGGRTARRQRQIFNAIESRFGKAYSVCVTRGPLQATESVRLAVSRGVELIIAVGGDGTIQEVVNGFFSNGQQMNPSCVLGIVNSGTGQGLAQSLGLPSGIERQVDIICDGKPHAIDVGRIGYSNLTGNARERHFINECQLGLGASVVKGVESTHKRLGGLLAFGTSTLVNALRSRPQPLVIRLDNTFEITQSLLGLAIMNGAHTGGGMNLVPQAKVDDGFLDVLLIHEQSIGDRVRNFPKIYSGRHVGSEGFSCFQAAEIAVSTAGKVPLAADGEVLGSTPCRVDVLPRALLVKSIG
jgi:diacylglycerol kinase (ATP)